MAGLVPAISIIGALCPPDRDRRDKPGDDAWATTSFAPVTSLPRRSWIIGDRASSHRRLALLYLDVRLGNHLAPQSGLFRKEPCRIRRRADHRLQGEPGEAFGDIRLS